jgi:methyl-accepting chemotaxis protein
VTGTAAPILRRALRPAIALMSRLRYAQKFLLIGLVMIVPLAWVVKSYLGVQSTGRSFATAEQAGVVYLKPTTDLLLSLVRARAVAVQVAAHERPASALAGPRAEVNGAIRAVDAAHDAAASLRLTGKWHAVRSQIGAGIAAPVTTPARTLSAYTTLTTGVESLIAQDGNNSNMILDPDSDAYYLMDAVLNRVTSLMDTAGQAGDLQTVVAATGRADLTKRLALEDLKSSILTTLANNDPDYASAFTNTHYRAMKSRLTAPLAAFDHSIQAVTEQLAAVVQGTLNGHRATELGSAAESNALSLSRATLPVINHLLDVRLGGFSGASFQTEVIALIGVLFALYLFAGFYLSVRRSQSDVVDGLAQLRTNCTDPLSEGLDALATGDLTRHIDAQAPQLAATTRDELGDVVEAVNAIGERVAGSIGSFNAMTAELRGMIGDVSASAGAVSAASQQVSHTSQEAGRATGEIAQAVSDVAQGAERQVTMIEVARHAADEVAAAVNESAASAQATADVGQEARRAAGEGVAAAEQANEAMRSVRDSSAAVTAAIAELAAKSEQIGAIVHTITGIAEQTNLLALNAAIEAARAGEQGRGFAVVAEEVRKLAEESQGAAAEISDLIGAIQVETARTVDVVQDGARRTDRGADVVEQTREAFVAIGASVQDMTDRVEQIAEASQRIADSAARMQETITEIAAVAEESSASTEEVSASTEETSASTEQIAASATELSDTAGALERLVSKFRVSD